MSTVRGSSSNDELKYDPIENTKKLLKIFRLNPSYFIQSEIVLSLEDVCNKNLFNNVDINNFQVFCNFVEQVLNNPDKFKTSEIHKEDSVIISKETVVPKNKKLEQRLKELLSKQLYNKLELGNSLYEKQELTLDQEFTTVASDEDVSDDIDSEVSESEEEKSAVSEEPKIEEEENFDEEIEYDDDVEDVSSDDEFSD